MEEEIEALYFEYLFKISSPKHLILLDGKVGIDTNTHVLRRGLKAENVNHFNYEEFKEQKRFIDKEKEMEEQIKKAYYDYLFKLSKMPKVVPLLTFRELGYIICNEGIVHSSYPKFKDNYLKNKEMEENPTIKDEVTWLRQALSIQGIEIHEKIIEVMIETYKVVKEKGNKTTFKDALDVTKEINRRNKTTVKYDIK
jgi:hypothetical protein